MSYFLIAQLDYIFFIYGLSFILLSGICAIMYRRDDKTSLPWHLLGLFGLSHGFNEWLDMLALSLGDSPLFTNIRIAIMALSFIFLLEFGRRGYCLFSNKYLSRWIYLPMAACVLVGFSYGTAETNAIIRYCFCLTGGSLAAWVLIRKAGNISPNISLYGAGIAMALYALAAGAVVPAAGFFPASVMNHNTFLAATGMPIQLIRAILAVICTCFVLNHHNSSIKIQLSLADDGLFFKPLWTRAMLLAATLLLSGWIAAIWFSSSMMQETESNILLQARYAAAAINTGRIQQISGPSSSEANSNYQRIREQLTAFLSLNNRLHLFQLFTMHEGKVYNTADSAPNGSSHHAVTGSLVASPAPELLEVFASARECLVKPHKGIHGMFVSGLTPVMVTDKPNPIAVLGVEIDAADWKHQEAHYRLLTIITTLVFSIATIGFFVILQRMMESTKLLEASRRKLAEAQLQRQHELEELNCTLEEEVEARTAKLTEINIELQKHIAEQTRTEKLLVEKNVELQHFAYIASHDLQEPLRTITSFIQLLAKRYQGKLDKDADDFIGFVTDGAKRMQTLINDLLAYSRVTSKAKPFTTVDLSRIYECALANLKHAISENDALITADSLPQVAGDETQLLQLIQNLLGNAIKFRSPGEQAVIHIGCRDEGDCWEFSVKDNGIGIAPQFHERIFEVFQRLHNREQYAGTGIGLAICKKIVERHGGILRVESEAGNGSNFVFQIRKEQVSPGVAA